MILLVLGAFLAGRAGKPKAVVTSQSLGPGTAITILLGQLRFSDGLTYSEFVKARYLHQCPQLNEREISYFSIMQHPPSGPVYYEILASRRGYRVAHCALAGNFAIGSIDETGMLSSLRHHDPVDDHSDWLDDFRKERTP
jgi:hypothetical protein